MKYSILTFGCRVNQADSMAIERDLRASGGEPAATSAEADLVIVNSCSVTATADQGTRQAIRRVARDNPSARIVVTGCYATRSPEELNAIPGVLRVVPNDRKDQILEELTTADRFAGADGPCGARVPLLNILPSVGTVPLYTLDRTVFALRVQTGCDEQCSYCIIPSTRGRSVSRPISTIVQELRQAERSGFRQVTLTGVHLGAYGRDLSPQSTLQALLESAIDGTSDVLFRLGSLEPMDVPERLPDLTDTGRLAPAFHLPLQHASDAVLARMRRPYRLDDYRQIVGRLRDRLPHAAIGSDIIVGFPGETHADFDVLCRYLESSPLTALHVFPYSDRPGTEASAFIDKVAGPLIRERGRVVREIGQRLASSFRAAQAGAIRPALTIEDGSVAITDNGFRVPVAGHRRNERIEIAVAP